MYSIGLIVEYSRIYVPSLSSGCEFAQFCSLHWGLEKSLRTVWSAFQNLRLGSIKSLDSDLVLCSPNEDFRKSSPTFPNACSKHFQRFVAKSYSRPWKVLRTRIRKGWFRQWFGFRKSSVWERYGEQKIAQFRTHDLTKESAYVSTQQSGQLNTFVLNHFSVYWKVAWLLSTHVCTFLC
jgi:hypothetical protein